MALAQLIRPDAGGVERNLPPTVLRFQAGDHLTGAGSVVYSADGERGTTVGAVLVGAGATAVQITDGATVVFRKTLDGVTANDTYFNPPKTGTKNTALTVTIEGGGTLDVHAWREE